MPCEACTPIPNRHNGCNQVTCPCKCHSLKGLNESVIKEAKNLCLFSTADVEMIRTLQERRK